MAKYRLADMEVEVVTFDEFKDNLGQYEALQPIPSGVNCYRLKMIDGYVHFSKDEVLVTLPEGKNIIFPKATIEEDFIKI